MQCLIVAAGQGLRLRARGPSKPLALLAGKPLIAHVLSRARAAGFKDFVVVTGHEAEHLESYLTGYAEQHGLNVALVHNPEFEKPNGLSVLAARNVVESPFLLTMCDHLIDSENYREMTQLPLGDAGAILAVDANLENPLVDLEDVTKVKTQDGKILAIGKKLAEYDAFDTGLFLASHALMDAIAESAEAGNASISGGVTRLAAAGKARIHDVTGTFWIDVDSPALFEKAEAHLAKA
ncbi:MAG TPA: NTP transferase domain-containing protein [Sphingomonadales bacterium]|nr:NTP transferase domain-containing protein [Sphingomonadales bacterium]